jgi:hypothetical protein
MRQIIVSLSKINPVVCLCLEGAEEGGGGGRKHHVTSLLTLASSVVDRARVDLQLPSSKTTTENREKETSYKTQNAVS